MQAFTSTPLPVQDDLTNLKGSPFSLIFREANEALPDLVTADQVRSQWKREGAGAHHFDVAARLEMGTRERALRCPNSEQPIDLEAIVRELTFV